MLPWNLSKILGNTEAQAKVILDEIYANGRGDDFKWSPLEFGQALQSQGFSFEKIELNALPSQGIFVITGSRDPAFADKRTGYGGLVDLDPHEFWSVVVIDGVMHCYNLGDDTLPLKMVCPKNMHVRCKGQRRAHLRYISRVYAVVRM
jgi:hypothetical protein